MEINMRELGFNAGDVCVITGAASGIGRATAKLAARSGLLVWAWDFSQESLAAVVKEIEDSGGQAVATIADVTDEAAVKRAWDQAASIGAPHYLVNNAGPAQPTPLSYMEGLIQGPGSQAVVTEEWLSRHGDVADSVVMIASIAAVMGVANWYGPAKAAVAGYARSVAVRCGGKPRANSIGPGLTRTPRTEVYGDELLTAAAASNPMRRIGEPEDLANAIVFMLSPAAGYINGTYLPVDGGALLL